MNWQMRAACAGLLTSGCVYANVVSVDRKTTLEQQAAGSYPTLTRDIDSAGVQPGAVPLTREQVAGRSTATADSDEFSDTARIDSYLIRQCVGEGLDGELVQRKETCQGEPEEAEVVKLLERANSRRQQVWKWLAKQSLDAKPAEVRAVWRITRLREVHCGAPVQNDDKTWGTKKC